MKARLIGPMQNKSEENDIMTDKDVKIKSRAKKKAGRKWPAFVVKKVISAAHTDPKMFLSSKTSRFVCRNPSRI